MIVFVSLVGIILVSAASFTVSLLKKISYNQHRVYATHHASILKEWLDGERLTDWINFQSYASQAGKSYCVNNELRLNTRITSLRTLDGSCIYNGISGNSPRIFKRVLKLTKDTNSTANRVTAEITVSWFEGEKEYEEVISAGYSVWQ